MKYKYSLIYLACSLGIIGFIGAVFYTSIPNNPVQLRIDLKREVFTIAPQGWAFFTRSPREAQIIIYEIKDNKLKKISHKHSLWRNFFGLSRKSTEIMSELQLIKAGIGKSFYINTEWNYQKGKIGNIPEDWVMVKNKMESPVLCGNYVVVYQEPVPWAWLKSIGDVRMPAKVIKLKILCN